MCRADGDGWLEGAGRNGGSSPGTDDGTFTADDGLEPKELAGETAVSMNLWGFSPAIWPFLADAFHAGPPRSRARRMRSGPAAASATEVLLPEVVGTWWGPVVPLAATPGHGDRRRVRVLPGTGTLVGVTHAEDLPVVRMELAEIVGQGLRPRTVGSGELTQPVPRPRSDGAGRGAAADRVPGPGGLG